MARKVYSGINIQYPVSERILSGQKVVETRTYPIPKHYLNQEMILIETPGKKGKFKARMRGIIIFTQCFQYKNKAAFYRDSRKHCVTSDSEWAWADQPKWGWDVEVLRIFDKPKPLRRKKGMLYTKNIRIRLS